MKLLISTLVISILSGCASLSLVSPISNPAAAQAPKSAEETFLNDLNYQIRRPDRKISVKLQQHEPTFAFDNHNNPVLQFNISEMPQDKYEIKEITVRLIELGVTIAQERNIALSGIEVVFFLDSGQPWLAIGSTPPWSADGYVVAPLHPDYIKRLEQMGVIKPAPEPKPLPLNSS
jgi:hypothetical protein